MRIAINPSTQYDNKYAGLTTSEGKVMHVYGEALAKELEKRGHKTIVTDSSHNLRAEINAIKAFDPDLFISLHSDGVGASAGNYFMVLYHHSYDIPLLNRVCDGLRKAFPGMRIKRGTDYQLSGHSLYVLRKKPCPGVLIEVDNHENPNRAKVIASKTFMVKVVKCLVDALVGETAELGYVVYGPERQKHALKMWELLNKYRTEVLKKKALPLGKRTFKKRLWKVNMYIGNYGDDNLKNIKEQMLAALFKYGYPAPKPGHLRITYIRPY